LQNCLQTVFRMSAKVVLPRTLLKRNRSHAVRQWTVLFLCALALIALPGTSVWATARSMAARAMVSIGRAVAPAFGLTALPPPPALTASTTASLSSDADLDTKADPGDVIRYSTTITNGGTDATAVHFSSTPPAGTTLAHAAPVAIDDSYSWVGNTQLD